ncbi:MAG TPA: VOC family protein [Thermomicrobiales bacterium]|nr:VOC family protein [Thermomicrobiales bacterium]
MDLLQVAQRATDLDRAVAFYTRLLGAPPVARFDPPGLAFFMLGPVRLLVDRAAVDRTAPGSLIYLKVDDVRTRIGELRTDGVTIEGEPHIIFSHADDTLGPTGTDEWHGFIRDSEGNLVGLVSHLPKES